MSKCHINEDLSSELLKSFRGSVNLNCLKLKENYLKFGGLSALADSLKQNKFLWPNL